MKEANRYKELSTATTAAASAHRIKRAGLASWQNCFSQGIRRQSRRLRSSGPRPSRNPVLKNRRWLRYEYTGVLDDHDTAGAAIRLPSQWRSTNGHELSQTRRHGFRAESAGALLR